MPREDRIDRPGRLQAIDTGAHSLEILGVKRDLPLPERLAENVRALREKAGLTQAELAKRAGVPRATWAHLESGAANPTLAVLDAVARAFHVSIEELVAQPRGAAAYFPREELVLKRRGDAEVRKLLPEPLPGVEIDRFGLPPGARMAGVPHLEGTREYLMCEKGEMELVVTGETYRLREGDVVAFRGDQRHAYANPGRTPAVGYSVVLMVR